MRFAQIRDLDVSNGEGIGMSLFLQGCPFHCKDCFNPETWDFNGGKEWTQEIENKFLNLISRPFIERVSILGGEPLSQSYELFLLISKIKECHPGIKVWIYSGYTIEEILNSRERTKGIIGADVLVDGRFDTNKKDINLKFKGSSNQRIIDIQNTLLKGEIVESK